MALNGVGMQMCYRRVCHSTAGDWSSNNPVLALSLRRCRTTAYTSSAAPRFPTMLLSPRPFGSRLGGRLGVISPELRPPLVAIPSVRNTAHTFMAHGSSVMRPLSSGIPPAVYNSWGTCDLTVHASPLRDIAPSRQGVGSSASAALLRPITCTSPSARQPLRGITPGLCFLRDPSRHAMRWAPAHNDA